MSNSGFPPTPANVAAAATERAAVDVSRPMVLGRVQRNGQVALMVRHPDGRIEYVADNPAAQIGAPVPQTAGEALLTGADEPPAAEDGLLASVLDTAPASGAQPAAQRPSDLAGLSRQGLAGQVYTAFLDVGFSEAQARALTAEINRENSMRPNLMFGTHSDPHNRARNVGMLSWQGDRARNLMSFLGQQGMLDEQGQIRRTPEALRAQALFLRQEMETRPEYARTRDMFLSNPNVDYDTAHTVLGDNFIRWRRTDPRYRDSGYRRIEEGYSLLGGDTPPSRAGSSSSAAALEAFPSSPDFQARLAADPENPNFVGPPPSTEPATAEAPRTFFERLSAGLEDLPEALRYLELQDNSSRMRVPSPGPMLNRGKQNSGAQALRRMGIGSLA
jgi:hypothetical protein